MSNVRETSLPGVGVRHDFTTREGDHIGMISHRSGRRDLLIYDRDDPDACGQVIRLEGDDVRTLSDMLGGDQVIEHLAELQSVPGLSIDWLPVGELSACSGHTLAELGVRADSGATIVAVVRGRETIPSPPPGFLLRAGDTAVAVGTPEGTRRLFRVLQGQDT